MVVAVGLVGVLACHNLLKDVTLEGRRVSSSVPEALGRIASRLEPWRAAPRSPSGGYDKLGPLYHLFAAMTAGVWGGSPWFARAAEYCEAALRLAHHGFDRPDPEKGEADRCGANVAFLIWDGAAASTPVR